jgi:MurNAc alpha-1-phosphate uridylyltransferase
LSAIYQGGAESLMDAIILAAGRGTRLQPLTDTLPKPLIEVNGLSLIEIHLHRLALAGFKRAIINLHHLGDLIKTTLGDGQRYGLQIIYSEEPGEALETAGGLVNALGLIKSDYFMVISADILCDYPLQQLTAAAQNNAQGHLIMVNNPAHHPRGDFLLDGSGHIALCTSTDAQVACTFSGLACFSKALFQHLVPGKRALRPVLEAAIVGRNLTGEVYSGIWSDIGTLERLDQARASTSIGEYIESVKQSIS